MSSIPAVFVSHGAPDLPIREGATQTFLRQFHRQIPQPTAILVVSAHWNTAVPTVSVVSQPKTIYDFSGFPEALYRLIYPAPGAPQLGDRVVQLLREAGLKAEAHPSRGLDHGAWTPLMLMYPEAQIPVTQLSIQYNATPAHHFNLGRALRPLREEGVLILASGAATHNLWAIAEPDADVPPDWVVEFDHWLSEAATHHRVDDLLHYRQLAPFAADNHPSDEHLLPFFVALGAGGSAVTQLHQGYTYGVLSMAAFAFE